MSDSTAAPQNAELKAASGRRVKWLPGIVFVMAGVGLLIAAVVLTRQTQDFLARAKRADGVIVDMRYGNRHPSVEFALPSGEKVIFWAGGWLSGHRLHQHVSVLYEPAAPVQTAKLDEPGSIWFGARFSGFLGAGQLLVGLLAMFVRSRNT
jgi:hypothetical protein